MANSDGGSWLDDRPDVDTDVYGFLLWEYKRLSLLTRLPSAKFHYDTDLDVEEAEKGAACASFAFQALYGEELGSNHTISVDGKHARTRCKSVYTSPLRRILKSFDRGTLPRFAALRPLQTTDDNIRKDAMVRVAYLAVVLLQWFKRVRSVLENETLGGGGVIAPVLPFVSMPHLARATWDWVHDTVAASSNTDAVSHQMLQEWLQVTTKPVVREDNPADWDLADAAPATASTHTTASHADASAAAQATNTDAHDIDNDVSANVHVEDLDSDEAGSEEDMDSEPELVFDHPEEAKEREHPPIPSHPPSEAQDSSAISGIDLQKVYFADIKLVTRVPTRFRQAWAKANAVVYEWVLDSEPGSQQRDNALFWELLLHRILLRADPRSRGRKRQSKDTMAARFKAFEEGDFQFLVRGLVKACDAVRDPFRLHVQGSEDETLAQVQKLLAAGRFSKAFRLLDSKGQGNMRDPGVVSQLDAKHGARVHTLPGKLPDNLPARVKLDGKRFKRKYRELKPKAGTGPEGYRNEYLTCLTAKFTCPVAKEAICRHRAVADMYVNADLPAWYYWIATSCAMVALIKSAAKEPGGTPDV